MVIYFESFLLYICSIHFGNSFSGGGPIHAHVPIHAHPQFSLRFIVFEGKYI